MDRLIKKITSRKFWAMVIAVISSFMILGNYAEGDIERITTILGSVGAIIVYITSEAYLDGKAIKPIKVDEELKCNDK